MKSYDLTTVDNATAFARIQRADAASAIRVPILVSAMSKAIRRYTGREFIGLNDETSDDGVVDVDAIETREFEYDGNGYLSLAPYEAREIESVTFDGDLFVAGVSGALESNHYAPQPRQKTEEGTYLYLALPETGRPCLVAVEGKWGIVEVPADVELACLHAVSDAYRNPEGAPQRILGDGAMIGEDSDQGGSLPRAARALLSPLCR